ncbi:MAG: peroxiredoxin family protein [Gemmataceae bacterium]|nr:peroxiredoxin family protein [Gemmataceae bacterium]
MIELGQLEANWQEFEKRQVRVVVVSVEDREAARATQADFPHLVIVSDGERKLSGAVEVIHQGSAPDGGDTAAPTTLLIDGKGTVRWTFRPDRVFTRLSPSEVLAAVDREMPSE